MKYFITDRNDEVLGPHSPDEIAKLLDSGAVEGTALCCEEGSETWLPLESILPPRPQSPAQTAAQAEPAPSSQEPSEASPEAAPGAPPREMPQMPKAPSKAQPQTPAAPTRPAPEAGAKPVLVLCVILALALILLGAYCLGRRL